MDPHDIREGLEYVRAELTAIHDQAEGRSLTDDEQSRWDEGEAFIAEQTPILERAIKVAEIDKLPSVPAYTPPQILNGSIEPEQGLRFDATDGEIRDAGLKALEQTRGISDDDRTAAERTASSVEGSKRSVWQRMILTGSDAYRSGFAKALDGMQGAWSPEEAQAVQRAASLSDAAGGYAVPFTLDPTIILTNAGASNAVRMLARTVQITTDSWNGVSSAGVTASWDAEAAEVSDDAPTLAQPSIDVEKAAAFVPFSIEIGQDWANMDSDIRMMFADAKDRLEGAAFISGAGSGSNQPTGITTELDGTASELAPATAETFAVADVYECDSELPIRYHGRSSTGWVLHRGTANAIRQFDTAGGSHLWERIGAGLPPELLGYQALVDNNMDDAADINAAATADNFVLVLGDWSNYVIVDRVGLSVELIPHLFATANNLPSGQRGLYAHWRVGGGSVNDAAFRMMSIPTTA